VKGARSPRSAFCMSYAVQLEGWMTCMYVRLLGPCFKTGGKPSSYTMQETGRSQSPKCKL